MLIAKRYAVLSLAAGQRAVPCPERPIRVAAILDVDEFCAGGALWHGRTVFLLDEWHDWNWNGGTLRYSGVGGQQSSATLAAVFESFERYFCPNCGQAMAEGMGGHACMPSPAR